MGNFFLFFSLSFFFFPVTHAACPILSCGPSSAFTVIRFPFQLDTQQPKNCGYPGFILSCGGYDQNPAALNLPYSGEFFVRSIDYLSQVIQLYDPDNCLPKRLILDYLNLSASPFTAAYYQNYTFLSCPTQLVRSRFTAIDCLSNSTTSVLATSSMTLARSMAANSCEIIVTLPVPVSWPVQVDSGFSSDLGNDLQLRWSVPDCRDCESQGGLCGFKSNSSQEIACFYEPGTGRVQSKSGLRVIKIILLCITLPAISCTVGIALFICFTDSRGRRQRASATAAASTAVMPQPATLVMTGLDDSTIESYTKLVLGESRRLPPGPNDNVCPICLSEYCTKETVKCIPDCKHCFHSDCIDEWLRMNNTCPLCRLSPSPSHVLGVPSSFPSQQ